MQGASITAALVGRSSELELLTGLLAATSRGEGGIAVVEGEPGIGKTRLLQEAIRFARTLSLAVHFTTAEELERDRPFGLVADALELKPSASDPDRARIGRALVPPDEGAGASAAPSSSPDLRFALVESIVRLVDRLASDAPMALVLEDVHWADSSSLLTLHRLAGSTAGLPVSILLSCRPVPRPPELERFLARTEERGGVRLDLRALQPEEVAELTRQHVGAVAGPRLLELVSRTGGNPLYVNELMSALQKEGLIEVSAGRAEAEDASLPPSLPLTILRGLSFLSDETLRTLRIASVLGSAFSPTDLSVVTQMPVTDLLATLDEALAARVVLERGDELAFRHDLIRDAIYEDMTEGVRKAIHAQAGRSLAEAGRPVAQVATHIALGASAGDRVAIASLQRAAEEAVSRAPRVAVELLRRAIELADPDVRVRDELEASLLDALFAAGSLNEAQELGRSLLSRSPIGDVELRVRVALTKVLHMQGISAESAEELQRLADDPRLPELDRARIFAQSAFSLAWVEGGRAARVVDEAEALSKRLRDDFVAYWATMAAASLADSEGRLAAGGDLGARAGKLALGLGREAVEHGLLTPPVAHLIDADRFDEAEQTLRTGLWAAEELGWKWQVLRHVWLASLWFMRGGWDDATAEAETAITLADEIGTRLNLDMANYFLVLIALHRDDLREASAHARRLGQADYDVAAQALVFQAKGDVEGCRQTFDRWLPELLARTSIDRDLGREIVPLLLWIGDLAAARTIAQRMQGIGERAGVASAEGVALYCRGLVEDDVDAMVEAVRAYERSPRVVELAQTREAAGMMLARKDRRAEAIGHLEQALETYERAGAAGAVARTEAALRGLGMRRGRRGRRARPATGWDSLTPSEVRVARLIAEGLLYQEVAARLFISRRTVETHVAHMFAKLGVSSRTQLAEIARGHG